MIPHIEPIVDTVRILERLEQYIQVGYIRKNLVTVATDGTKVVASATAPELDDIGHLYAWMVVKTERYYADPTYKAMCESNGWTMFNVPLKTMLQSGFEPTSALYLSYAYYKNACNNMRNKIIETYAEPGDVPTPE